MLTTYKDLKMSKFVNVTVSTSLSTDFYLEVPDDATEEQIRELAEKEVILPNNYPSVLDTFLKTRMGIYVGKLDSMLKSWNIDELTYIIDGGNYSTYIPILVFKKVSNTEG